MDLQRLIDVPPLDFRAAVGAVDTDARIVALTFSTGADVVRYDWETGERYIERLSMDAKSVRLKRLNSGAPLLNTHSAYDLSDQIGVVEDDSATVDGKKGRAAVRFSKRSDVEPYYQDVLDRIYRNVSVGYRVHKFEETSGNGNKMPVRLAIDWEPFEVSLVPMPADIGAQTKLGAKTRNAQLQLNPCVLITRSIEAIQAEDADRMRRLRLAKARSK